MYIPRIFLNKKINIHEKIELNTLTFHYCIHVIRLKIGNIVHIFNNTNYIFISTIINIKKNSILVQIKEKKQDNRESKLNIHLGQTISKRMNMTLEKSVELGVNSITPIIPNQKNRINELKKKINQKILHWKKIIIAACSQSKRNIVPTLGSAQTLSEWCQQIPRNSTKIIFTLKAKKSIYHVPSHYKNIYILIGKETGFTNPDIQLAKEKNFLSISLGPRVLRTETSSIVAIAALETHLGKKTKKNN
ncbi:16S rRNA (uracil(1498)-N(3))-methyltransferase [Buchnera aphidicola]|uniref:16S rRNA (uracil(1498)-N(3))-methyltransferase n=1 Tax=Buchnera aphidicola TaxID=9 RepID=UPI00094C303A|nr:16S rRNA (uracil(1498)-N(3))-methyltransferase [Buchnera aphidicola]